MFNKKTFRLANRELYEECQIDDQCTGASGKGVCREVVHRKLCLCDKGYVEDKESLKCRKGKTLSKKKHMISITYILFLTYKTC